MNNKDHIIRFDWAMKHMLRDKANFGILEGLISVLLKDDVKIVELLESESNQKSADDKFNRVDIKAKNSEGHIIIVEVQLTSQLHYLERILYGVSKAVTEHISLGEGYDKVKKVYSISILYCKYGEGKDYVYHGHTVFRGLHSGDELTVPFKQDGVIINRFPREVFPEFYVVRVDSFDKVPDSPLDEWMEYLKTGNVNDNATAPGLDLVRTKLRYMKMTKSEQKKYEHHLDNVAFQNDVFASAHVQGLEEGKAIGIAIGLEEGKAKGLAEGKAEGLTEGKAIGIKEATKANAKALLSLGVDKQIIAQATGLSLDEINELN